MKGEIAIALPRYLTFIDGSDRPWQEQARQCIESGQNIFVLLPRAQSSQLAGLLGVNEVDLPTPLTTAALLSFSRFLETFRLAEKTPGAEESVFYIEQIALPQTRPPRVKNYLVYCHLRGILNQHDLSADARAGCDDYNEDRPTRNNFPEAGVYRWQNNQWRRTALC